MGWFKRREFKPESKARFRDEVVDAVEDRMKRMRNWQKSAAVEHAVRFARKMGLPIAEGYGEAQRLEGRGRPIDDGAG